MREELLQIASSPALHRRDLHALAIRSIYLSASPLPRRTPRVTLVRQSNLHWEISIDLIVYERMKSELLGTLSIKETKCAESTTALMRLHSKSGEIHDFQKFIGVSRLKSDIMCSTILLVFRILGFFKRTCFMQPGVIRSSLYFYFYCYYQGIKKLNN